jgi:hypothetical protein
MRVAALIVGIFAGLCAVMGVVVATDAYVPDYAGIKEWVFWFGLAGVLFLATIALAVAGREE